MTLPQLDSGLHGGQAAPQGRPTGSIYSTRSHVPSIYGVSQTCVHQDLVDRQQHDPPSLSPRLPAAVCRYQQPYHVQNQLSLTLFAIIGGFWLLDSLKDTVLEGTVGLEYQPRAKLVSVAVTLLLVIQYNRLVDSCSKPTVSGSRML